MHKVVLWVQAVLIPTLGPAGIFVVAFFDSSFLTIPEINDILVVNSSAVHPRLAWLYVGMATLGSLGGCTVLWWLGRRGGEALLLRRFGKERMEATRGHFKRWDVMALAIPAVLPPPMPFKIFCLSAGVFGLPFRRFALTLLVARGLRYGFWGGMGVVYGDEALLVLQGVDAWFAERLPVVAALALGALVAVLAVLVLRILGRRADAPRAG